MSHTSGRWKAHGEFIGTAGEDPQTICYMSNHRNRKRRNPAENRSNALLIAASPQMLEVCEDIDKLFSSRQGLDYDYWSQEEKDLHNKAKKVLAIVKGKS